MKMELQQLRKLAKRGSNQQLLTWLESYGNQLYNQGLSHGIRTGIMDVITQLHKTDDTDLRREINETMDELNETLNVRPDMGGKS